MAMGRGEMAMHAAISSTDLRPGAIAGPAPALLAWTLIGRLVAFDTTSRESNLALIECVRDYLEAHGALCRLTFDDTRRKANLFATLATQNGNGSEGGVVLSGHTDVVPVDGQPWNTNPFEAVRSGDKVFGRGVADMKSFCATALAFVPEITRRGLGRPLHFAFSYDEEVGCFGARRMIADIAQQGIRPIGCIVGEPTGMEIAVAHKGRKSWRCRVRGFEAHSALTPHGVNAVHVACEIVSYLARVAATFRDSGRRDDAYDVPYTTVHTGTIHGGTALNIVPRDCHFEFEIRHLPFDDPDAFFADVRAFAERLLPEMRKVAHDATIEFDALSGSPGFATAVDSEIARLGRACSEATQTRKVSFGSEAPLFDGAAIPTIVCGPGHIAQAHQPNEWVAIEQLARCESFMRRLAERICVS
jgi:acetylornithine deacetylase